MIVPTSLEELRRHRSAHEGDHESKKVWLFHSHVYFDHDVPAEAEAARRFMELVRTTFAGNPHVELSSFVPRPAGPHPRGSFETLFTRDAFADYVSWLMFARPEGLSVLIHPLTRSQADDHVARALWLGERLEVDAAFLQAVDARTAERTEESIIDGTKKH